MTKHLTILIAVMLAGAVCASDFIIIQGQIGNIKGTIGNVRFQISQTGVSEGNDSFAKLLLHCDGTNTSQVFTDSSTSNNTVTVLGNSQISTAQKKFGTGSGLFDGNGDYLMVSNSVLNFGTNDFTIDCWVKWIDTSTYAHFFDGRLSDNTEGFSLGIDGSGAQQDKIWMWYNGFFRITSSTSASTNWSHVALVRNGNVHTVYLGGVAEGAWTNAATYTSKRCYIGKYYSSASYAFYGNLDEYRVSIGIARWTNNFTPSTQSYGE